MTCHKKIRDREQIWHEQVCKNTKVCLCCQNSMKKIHFKSIFTLYVLNSVIHVTKKSFLSQKNKGSRGVVTKNHLQKMYLQACISVVFLIPSLFIPRERNGSFGKLEVFSGNPFFLYIKKCIGKGLGMAL